MLTNKCLSEIKEYEMPLKYEVDLQDIYEISILINTMIFENNKVDYYTKKVQGLDRYFTIEHFELAKNIKKAFLNNNICKMLNTNSKYNHFEYNSNFIINYSEFQFEMAAGANVTLLQHHTKIGCDLKFTSTKTLQEFKDSCIEYSYYRKAALAMDVLDLNNFMLIGISKKNYNVFIIPIKKGDDNYKTGKKEYEYLSFNYFTFYGDLNKIKRI